MTVWLCSQHALRPVFQPVWPCLLPDLAASSSNKPELFRVTDTATKPGMPGCFIKHIIAWVALAQELVDVKDRIRAHGLARAASAPDSLVRVVEHEKPCALHAWLHPTFHPQVHGKLYSSFSSRIRLDPLYLHLSFLPSTRPFAVAQLHRGGFSNMLVSCKSLTWTLFALSVSHFTQALQNASFVWEGVVSLDHFL